MMQMQHLETRLSLPYVIGTVSFSAGELLFAAVNLESVGIPQKASIQHCPPPTLQTISKSYPFTLGLLGRQEILPPRACRPSTRHPPLNPRYTNVLQRLPLLCRRYLFAAAAASQRDMPQRYRFPKRAINSTSGGTPNFRLDRLSGCFLTKVLLSNGFLWYMRGHRLTAYGT